MPASEEHAPLQGLIAATYTPLDSSGQVNPTVIAPMVDHLIRSGCSGLYVCGSTGEGVSLSTAERKLVAETYIQAGAGRLPVLVQVGHNSLSEACELAAHAEACGATAISATCPSYFKIGDVPTLIESVAEMANAASGLPFYYYHIPALTGSAIDMVAFMPEAAKRIPNLVGLKYTDTKLFEFQACQEIENRRFDIVWGCDEMLLGALATGANAAIGSTYNIAAPLYQRLITAVNEGDLSAARAAQLESVKLIRLLLQYPFHPAMKAVLEMLGFEMGRCRLPQRALTTNERDQLRRDLESFGFFERVHSLTPTPHGS